MGVKSLSRGNFKFAVNETFFKRHWEFFRRFFPGITAPPRMFGRSLVFRDFQKPGGGMEIIAMLEERSAAKVLALTEDSKVVAVRQYKYGAGVCLELPGGAKEKPGELFEETASRELREETGYQAESLVKLGPPLYRSTRNSTAVTAVYLALGCRKIAEPKAEPDAEEEMILIPWQEWLRLCHAEIVDPFSVAATFRALPYVHM